MSREKVPANFLSVLSGKTGRSGKSDFMARLDVCGGQPMNPSSSSRLYPEAHDLELYNPATNNVIGVELVRPAIRQLYYGFLLTLSTVACYCLITPVICLIRSAQDGSLSTEFFICLLLPVLSGKTGKSDFGEVRRLRR